MYLFLCLSFDPSAGGYVLIRFSKVINEITSGIRCWACVCEVNETSSVIYRFAVFRCVALYAPVLNEDNQEEIEV